MLAFRTYNKFRGIQLQLQLQGIIIADTIIKLAVLRIYYKQFDDDNNEENADHCRIRYLFILSYHFT